ncbi:MAG: leucine-rich repeat protein, partial [Clostridiales Family XIII bacterium]|nr:leucine-rich repeat protein [Clostridiales Family XIII bacterium]
IEIPNIVTEIGERMFQDCTGLTSIAIPNHVTSIGAMAFMGCSNLTSVDIAESVTNFGSSIFANDSKLSSITIKAANPTFSTTGNVFSNLPAGLDQLKIWLYNSATAAKTAAGARLIIMIKAPVLNITDPITLDLDAGDPTNSDTASLSVTGYEPVAQTETTTGGNIPTLKGWTSSNEAAATVNASGSVLAKNPGTALITATINAHGGEKTASVPVTVLPESGATTKVLTVKNGKFIGTGSGNDKNGFAAGAKVTIVADTPKDGQVFAGWTGADASSFTDPTSPTTVFTMPDAAATVTATYKNVHALTVTNGTGDGSYASGKEIAISALPALSGKVFDKWTTSNGGSFASATSADTTFTMPDNAVTVTATYKDAPVTPPPATTVYAVTVVSGTDGANGTYATGATVNITANAPASGKVFDKWTSNDGVTFANASNSATSFVMPAKDVTVTATYKDEPVDPPVNPPVDPPVADNGWVHEDGVWKYFVDGVAKTGWVYDQSTWYYLNAAGEMQTGWVYDHNTWYYLAGNGAMKTGWVKDSGSWYRLAGNGAMVASKWLKDTDGNWYYLSGNGKMLTGKQKIGGKVYSFKTNGVWIS